MEYVIPAHFLQKKLPQPSMGTVAAVPRGLLYGCSFRWGILKGLQDDGKLIIYINLNE